MTSRYNAALNQLQELPQMEKPDAGKILGGAPTGVDYEVMDELMDKYLLHKSSLRTLNCHEDCKGLWKDGKTVEEGKDYKIGKDCQVPSNCFLEVACVTCDVIAIPLKVKEDEFVWTDALVNQYAEQYRFSSSRISIKQFKESITKKK